MKQIIEIARKELQMFLYSPLGWLVLVTMVIQMGSYLVNNLDLRLRLVASILDFTPSITYNLLFYEDMGLITGIGGQLYLYLPLLTMGLLSREYSEGTIKLLYSSPLKVSHIVLGKYLSIVTVGLLLTAIIGLYGLGLYFFFIKDMDIILLLFSLLMFFLLVSTYAAIGLFISSLTSYQFVAALGAVGVLFLLQYATTLSAENTPEFVSAILVWLQGTSLLNRFKGYLGTWDILYFILMISMFLGLTLIRLQTIRQSVTLRIKLLKYCTVVVLVLALGYISSHPSFKYYFDVRNPIVKDTQFKIQGEDIGYSKSVLTQLIPITVITAGATVIWRRRRR